MGVWVGIADEVGVGAGVGVGVGVGAAVTETVPQFADLVIRVPRRSENVTWRLLVYVPAEA